jgi:hypothetical protein
MKRTFVTTCALLSTLLCGMVLAFWVRSYFVCDLVRISFSDPKAPQPAPPELLKGRNMTGPVYLFHRLDVESAEGGLCVANVYLLGQAASYDEQGSHWYQHNQSNVSQVVSQKFGFGWGLPGTRLSSAVMVPYWFIVLLTAPLPVIWAWRETKLRRARTAGLCKRCGYDLRATPDRCPECGAEAAERLEPQMNADGRR